MNDVVSEENLDLGEIVGQNPIRAEEPTSIFLGEEGRGIFINVYPSGTVTHDAHVDHSRIVQEFGAALERAAAQVAGAAEHYVWARKAWDSLCALAQAFGLEPADDATARVGAGTRQLQEVGKSRRPVLISARQVKEFGGTIAKMICVALECTERSCAEARTSAGRADGELFYDVTFTRTDGTLDTIRVTLTHPVR